MIKKKEGERKEEEKKAAERKMVSVCTYGSSTGYLR